MDYNTNKITTDNDSAVYLMNRLLTSIDSSDALANGTIDEYASLVNKPETEDEKSAYTLFDKIIFALKSSISEERIEEILQPYVHMNTFDPVFVSEKGADYKYRQAKKAYTELKSIINSLDYLPMGMTRDDVIDEDVTRDEIRVLLTDITFLIYTLKMSKIPGKSLYKTLVSAVEDTFGFKSNISLVEDSYNKFIESDLIEGNKTTKEALGLLAKCSKIIISNDLALEKKSRFNQLSQWSFLERAEIHV